MEQVNIRWLNIDDLDDWATIANALWPQLEIKEHRKRVVKIINSDSKRRGAIAITEECHLAGFAELGIRAYADGCTSQPVAYLEGIWVDPACRRKNIGEKLLSFLTVRALEGGFTEICSNADINNAESHIAHANWGFTEISKVTNFRKALK